MRTVTGSETTLLQGAHFATFARVLVEDADGTYQDLTNQDSIDWVHSGRIAQTIDQIVATGAFTFWRKQEGGNSLAPLDEDSTLNRDAMAAYAALIDVGRGIRCEFATVAIGSSPSGGDWQRVFDGVIDQWAVADDFVQVMARDAIGAEIADRWIEAERTLGTGPGRAMEDVIQDILTEWTGLTLFTPTSPSFLITTYIQQRSTVMDALQQLAALTGWVVQPRWDDGTSSFRLTLYDPDRAPTSTTWTWEPDRYEAVPDFTLSRLDIRNTLSLWYTNISDVRAQVTASDATSITKYGRQWMEIEEPKDSPIDTSTEAQNMLDKALLDLKDPVANQEIKTLCFWPIQLNDFYLFSANDVHYSEDQQFGVTGFRHEFSAGHVDTFIRTRGVPAGFVRVWLQRAISDSPREEALTFRQTSAPTARSVGDIWFDTDDGDHPYRWSGTAWLSIVPDIDTVDLVGSIVASQISVANLSAIIADMGTLTAGQITVGSMSLNAVTEQLLFGSATAPATGTGIFLGKDGADYEFRAGVPGGNQFQWDGTDVLINGAVVTGLASLSDISLVGFSHDLVFSATDNDTVAWGTGTITNGAGASFSIVAGNTGTMAAATYIFLDRDVSSTVLQTTTTAASATGVDRILVAVANNVADAAKDAEFLVYGGSGDVGLSNTILVGNIAASTITGNEVLTMNLTSKSLTADTGTVGGWTLASGTLSSGSVTISATAERILMGSATAPLTGTGIFIGKDGADYEMRFGNPAGAYLHWDGTDLKLNGTVAATNLIVNGDMTITGALDVGTSITLGNDIFMEGTAPKFRMHETDAAASEGEWDLIAEAGLMRFRTLADGGGSGQNIFTVARTGTVVDLLHVENGDFQVSDNVGIGQAPGSAALEVTETTSAATTGLFTNSHASAPNGLHVDFSAAAPNDTVRFFLKMDDSAGLQAVIYSDGSYQGSANSYGALSDRRLKAKIETAPSNWDLYRRLRWVDFEKIRTPGVEQHGLIAQEVIPLFPDCVYEDGTTGMYGLNYMGIATETGKVAQECQARIVTNEEKIRRLADEVRELKASRMKTTGE